MPEWPENRSHSDPLATGKGVPAPPKTLPRTRHLSLPTLVRGRAACSPFCPWRVLLARRGGSCRSLSPSWGVPGGLRVPCAAGPGADTRSQPSCRCHDPPSSTLSSTSPLGAQLPPPWPCAAGWGRTPKTLGEGGTQRSRTPSCTPSPPRHPLPSLPRVRGKKPRNVHFQRSFGCKSVYTWRGKIFLSCRVGIFIE